MCSFLLFATKILALRLLVPWETCVPILIFLRFLLQDGRIKNRLKRETRLDSATLQQLARAVLTVFAMTSKQTVNQW